MLFANYQILFKVNKILIICFFLFICSVGYSNLIHVIDPHDESSIHLNQFGFRWYHVKRNRISGSILQNSNTIFFYLGSLASWISDNLAFVIINQNVLYIVRLFCRLQFTQYTLPHFKPCYDTLESPESPRWFSWFNCASKNLAVKFSCK